MNTVRDLIEKLQGFDPNLPIRKSDYEYGMEEIESVYLESNTRYSFSTGRGVNPGEPFIVIQ